MYLSLWSICIFTFSINQNKNLHYILFYLLSDDDLKRILYNAQDKSIILVLFICQFLLGSKIMELISWLSVLPVLTKIKLILFF